MLTMAERFVETSVCISDIGALGRWILDVDTVIHDIGLLGSGRERRSKKVT